MDAVRIVPPAVRRIVSALLHARPFAHLLVVLPVFIGLRLAVALRDGIIMAGDGAPEVGEALGRLWIGDASLAELLSPGSQVATFLTQRTSQLLYPLLISLHAPLGLDPSTHVLILNSLLGALLVVGAYYVGLRLHGPVSALLAALLMCSLTGLYWIARYAVVDNAFYAAVPLAALAVLRWNEQKTVARGIAAAAAFAALLLTRPESIFVVLAVLAVLAWTRCRRFVSLRTAAAAVAGLAVAGFFVVVLALATLPALQRQVLSRAHIAWGLAGSAHTLLNRAGTEFDAVAARYVAQPFPTIDDMHYQMSMDAVDTIRDNPLWYAAKIPLRGLAILHPWTFQPWSVAHIGYEAIYTLFISAGLVLLLMRRTPLPLAHRMVLAIPLGIWLFLAAYMIDNDLKHRNGLLVALNLVAPLGYLRERRAGTPAPAELTPR